MALPLVPGMFLAGSASPTFTDWLSAIGTAAGAFGTVGALIFLGIQARLLGKQTAELHVQNEAEADARRQDERRRRAEFRSEHTPFLSVEAIKVDRQSGDSGDMLLVELRVHADGSGAAHNVIVNFSAALDPPPHRIIATEVVFFLRAPGERRVTLLCPISIVRGPQGGWDLKRGFRLEVGFRNMFNETVRFTHPARFRHVGRGEGWVELEITDAPTYEWPWDFLLREEGS